MKAIQDGVVQLTKNRVSILVPVKEWPAKLRGAKARNSGTVLEECKAFAKKLKKGKRSTLEWWKCY